MTKGHDQKRDTLPQNQTPNKVFSVLPLESGMFQLQATISIIKFFVVDPSVCCISVWHQIGVRSGVDVCNITMDTMDVIIIQRKTICMQF